MRPVATVQLGDISSLQIASAHGLVLVFTITRTSGSLVSDISSLQIASVRRCLPVDMAMSIHLSMLFVGARPPIGWLRTAMVAVLGNPGSGKVSECPGVQLSPAPYAEASAGPLREGFTTSRSCGDQLEVFIYVV